MGRKSLKERIEGIDASMQATRVKMRRLADHYERMAVQRKTLNEQRILAQVDQLIHTDIAAAAVLLWQGITRDGIDTEHPKVKAFMRKYGDVLHTHVTEVAEASMESVACNVRH